MGNFLSRKFDPLEDLVDLKGKVAIVTGGNTGIGLATVRHLARAGAKVYLTARNESRAAAALKQLELDGLAPGNGQVLWLKLDLSDPRDAKKSAEEFLEKEARLDILVNNAGLITAPYTIGADGLTEMVMVNYISPVAFTQTLLPLLQQTAKEVESDVRIVNVTSIIHKLVPASVKFDDVSDFNVKYARRPLSSLTRYGHSKFMISVWTRTLQRQLNDRLSPIMVIAVHPGSIDTFSHKWIYPRFFHWLVGLVLAQPEVGAYNSAFAAAGKDIMENRDAYRGVYLESQPTGRITKPHKAVLNDDLGDRLQKITNEFMQDRQITYSRDQSRTPRLSMSDIDSASDDGSNAQSELCDTCRYFLVGDFFVSPGDRESTHDALEEILARHASCALCRLIGHAIHQSACASRNVPPPLPADLPLFNPRDMFPTMKSGNVYIRGYASLWITEPKQIEGLENADLSYKLKRRRLEGRPAASVIRIIVELGVLEALMGEIRLLASDTEQLEISPSFHGRLVNERVDIGLVHDMIKRCSKHPKCQETTSGRVLTNVRVIDTLRHSVVPMDVDSRYVALSYTWGGDQQFKLLLENISQWSQPAGMPALDDLPPTIRDSIILCKQLNQRYLWIDSLCITQNDPSTLQGQLEQMDLIYQLAEFTIIAAAGLGANAGLPGISTTRRESHQLIEKVQDLHLAVPLPSLSESGKHSFWKTRAWTYQEQMLSRKVLVFTPRQVYFECLSEIYSEDRLPYTEESNEVVLQIDSDEARGGLERLSPLDLPLGAPTQAEQDTPFNSFGMYQTAVTNYTARNLGNPTDILNAFIGVANALQPYAGVRGFVGGLSVMGLSDALLWKPVVSEKPHVRRQCLNPAAGRLFPTWSWAGWAGAVTVERNSDVLGRQAVVSEWAVIHGSQGSSEQTVMILPSVEIDDFKDDELFSTTPIPWNLLHAHILRLKTSICYDLQIIARGPEWTDLCAWDATEGATSHRACIFSPSGACIGSIVLDDAVQPSSRKYMLIAVSKGWHPRVHYSRGFSMREGGGISVYNILVGEQHEEGIERRGIGVVVTAEWENADALEEVISLV